VSLFFLQAEDGIRDRNVTGVQTCALPICTISVPRPYAACHVCRGNPVRGVIDQSISSAEPSCATRDVLPCPCPTRDGTSAWSTNDGTGYHVRHFRVSR